MIRELSLVLGLTALSGCQERYMISLSYNPSSPYLVRNGLNCGIMSPARDESPASTLCHMFVPRSELEDLGLNPEEQKAFDRQACKEYSLTYFGRESLCLAHRE